jgi:hypothetical protein
MFKVEERVHVGARVPRSLVDRFESVARKRGAESMSAALRRAMSQFVSENDERPLESGAVESPAGSERERVPG